MMSMLIEKELNRRLLQGGPQTRDLVRLRSTYIAQERMLYETGQRTTRDEGMALVRQLLQFFAPKMAEAVAENDDKEAVERIRLAQGRINSTPVEDKGPAAGHDRINMQLAAKFASVTAKTAGPERAE
jgi:hypothetical protein